MNITEDHLNAAIQKLREQIAEELDRIVHVYDHACDGDYGGDKAEDYDIRAAIDEIRHSAKRLRALPAPIPTIQQVCDEVAATLAPDVIRIRGSARYDGQGEECVFVNILITDAVAQELWGTTKSTTARSERWQRICDTISHELGGKLNGRGFMHTNYRSVSEQEKLRQQEWE